MHSVDQHVEDISLYLVNARSLKKPNALYQLEVDLHTYNATICCISETWLTSDILSPSLEIAQYSIFRADRNSTNSAKLHGGGVCVYVRDCVPAYQLYPPGAQSYELIWMYIQVPVNPLYVALIYYPPDQRYCDALAEHILYTVDNYHRENPNANFIVCGDFNAFDPSLFTDSPLVQISDFATRGNAHLDRIFISDTSALKEIYPVTPNISTDHLAIIANFSGFKPGTRKVAIRDFRESAKHSFNSAMDGFDFEYIYHIPDVSMALKELILVIQTLLDEHCPKKFVLIKPKDPPFVTPLIKLLLTKKRRLQRKGRHAEVIELSSRIGNLIRENVRNSTNKRGSRAWWNRSNALLGRSKRINTSSLSVSANDFNEYYASINTTGTYEVPPFALIEDCDVPVISCLQVYNHLHRTKKTAAGIDGIPSWVYRENAHNIAEAVTYIFNKSLREMNFPEVFKLSSIHPVPKVNRPVEVKDFRPVSITPILSRIFERIVYSNYVSPMYNKWINPTQFGFRERCSTEQAVIKMLNDITVFRNEGADYVRVFALDMSKAFDNLSHRCIVESLMSIRPPVNGYIINWIRSFITDRKQVTVYNNITSIVLSTNQGVPQGTVGGPYCYNIATNSITVSDSTAKLTAFADDNTPIVAGFHNEDSASHVITSLVSQFSQRNLKLNERKCKEMRIMFNHHGIIETVANIETCDSICVLGFTLSCNLSFKAHVETMIKRAYSALYQIYRLRSFACSKKDLQFLYQSLVVTRLTYGLSVWGGETKTILNSVDRVQRKAVRLGIIDSFTPIVEFITRHDEKLFQRISADSTHPLARYIPERTVYATERLRSRLPAASAPSEKLMSFFPNRYLRSTNLT